MVPPVHKDDCGRGQWGRKGSEVVRLREGEFSWLRTVLSKMWMKEGASSLFLFTCRHSLQFENGLHFLPPDLNITFVCFLGLLSLTLLNSV